MVIIPASAILANEAFTAAADPKRFPEQLNMCTTLAGKTNCYGILSILAVLIQ